MLIPGQLVLIPEHFHTLNVRLNILESSKDVQNKNIVLSGDFNVILNPL